MGWVWYIGVNSAFSWTNAGSSSAHGHPARCVALSWIILYFKHNLRTQSPPQPMDLAISGLRFSGDSGSNVFLQLLFGRHHPSQRHARACQEAKAGIQRASTEWLDCITLNANRIDRKWLCVIFFWLFSSILSLYCWHLRPSKKTTTFSGSCDFSSRTDPSVTQSSHHVQTVCSYAVEGWRSTAWRAPLGRCEGNTWGIGTDALNDRFTCVLPASRFKIRKVKE